MSESGAVQDGSFYTCSVAQIFTPGTAELLNSSGNPDTPRTPRYKAPCKFYSSGFSFSEDFMLVFLTPD